MVEQDLGQEFSMNADALYREDVITDRRVGTIRCLTPVNEDGSEDESRPKQFIGSAQILTPGGTLPLTFELEASNLKEAVAVYPDAAKEALERTVEELKEMQREAASSIVVPKAGEVPGGGNPGGGLQMP